MELRDLYDIDRIPLGKTSRRGKKPGRDEYFAVVHLCIFNSQGQMLIQQRQSFKKGWAGCWDLSVGGGVLAGETSRMAVARELREELGLDLDFSGCRPRLTVNFDHGFDDFYIIERDIDLGQLQLQYEEVQAVKWADRDEIMALIGRGAFIPFLSGMIDLLFQIRNKPDCLDL
ncbi:MAG: NUDIX domain-containing protein [Oscillospiraceae bacterium]|nr:NUDIX domain-containing protein [Oscillospiraceae bacterium]